MALKLIHFPQSRSLRVLWALYELGVEAELDVRPFGLHQLKEPEYRRLNPLGKAPVFSTGTNALSSRSQSSNTSPINTPKGN